MTLANDARSSLYAAFSTGWGDETPFVFQNEADDSSDEWTRCSVLNGAGGQITLNKPGARIYRREGIVFVEIYVPTDAGTSRMDTLSALAMSIFEGKSIDEVSLNDAVYREMGPQGRWFKGTVTVAFDYDETK